MSLNDEYRVTEYQNNNGKGSLMRLTLQYRVVGAMFASTLLSLLVTSFVIATSLISSMESTLKTRLETDLTSKRELIKRSVQDYFLRINNQITTMAQDVTTVERANAFISSFESYPIKLEQNEVKTSVSQYYSRNFAQEYDTFNHDTPDINYMLSGLSDRTYAMQYSFISNNPNPLGKKDILIDVANNSDYQQVHIRHHPSIQNFLQTFGYYDIFITDAQGNIVYSVFKELDFATNLNTGPYASTGIGEVFKKAVRLPRGESYLSDFASYLPSYNNPASFIGSPIYDQGKVIGTLIFQMPIDKLNSLLTHNKNWANSGFGNTGESYLIGGDKTLRTEKRKLFESPKVYFDGLRASLNPQAEIIAKKQTGLTLHSINNASVNAALSGRNGVGEVKNLYGEDVFSSYAPIDIGNMTWVILAEISEKEAFETITALSTKAINYTLLVLIVLGLGSLLVAWGMTKILLRPIKVIGRHFENLNSADADLTRRVPQSNIPELNRIEQGFNEFILKIQRLLSSVKSEAELVASASTQLSRTIARTSQTASQQQEEAKQVTFAIEQFNKAIQLVSENSENASNNTSSTLIFARENSEKANLAAREIADLVKEVNLSARNIEHLKQEVDNINQVLDVINGIADQTNLLALNAAIEAARAGEHGRGFSVVADEVRQLASKTQESTVDIQNKISSLTQVVNGTVESMLKASSSASEGIRQVESVSSAFTELNSTIDELAKINVLVASSADEQLTTCESINQNMTRLAESAVDLSHVSVEATKSSEQLSRIAEEMLVATTRFKT